MATKTLIIPAAGAGKRMQRQLPKPYLQLSGRSILEHTIRRFLPLEGLQEVIIATSGTYLEEARDILQKILPGSIEGICVEGGEYRQESISQALQEVARVDLVLIHDAVRPFVELPHIETCCRTASKMGAAVVGVPAKDTIKQVDDRQVIQATPDRNYLWQSQTPQVFEKSLIVRAYRQAMEDEFLGTDDASLVERLGQPVQMVKGEQSNFKITFPLDLKLAKLMIEDSA